MGPSTAGGASFAVAEISTSLPGHCFGAIDQVGDLQKMKSLLKIRDFNL